jgi:hypothetical protein
MIKKDGSKYTVVSDSGKKMGTYSSKKAALRRLQQIEMFREMKKK